LGRNPLHILPYESCALGAAGFPSLVPVHEIKRGKPFYFRFMNDSGGFAIGFQRQNNVWLSLPLDRVQSPVPVSAGVIELPNKQTDGRNIDPITEETARDLLEFMIVVYTDKDILQRLHREMMRVHCNAMIWMHLQIRHYRQLYTTSLLVT